MLWFDTFLNAHKNGFPHVAMKEQVRMDAYTTFKIGGPARVMAFPETVEECISLLSGDWPVLVIGKGSNLLISDKGIDCLVVNTSEMDHIERRGDVIYAEAGIPLSRLAVFALKESLAGLSFAHGIPGSLGGAVFMNAGAYGGEMCQAISRVGAYIKGKGVVTLSGDELQFGYRSSIFSKEGGTVLWAELSLKKGDPAVIQAEMEDYRKRRQEKQPLTYPSAGSTFKRPAGYFAGALIEQCGLKGFSVGGAEVSTKHAGFVINKGNATASDVLALIEIVQNKVQEETGILLEPEIRLIGE